MKVRNLFIFLIFVLATTSGSASDVDRKAKKNVCQINGEVLDKTNAEALTGATVRIVELDVETFVDFDGSFSINGIPAGKYTIEISMVSYPTKRIENVEIEKTSQNRRYFL
jgi:hypothetical protein